MTKKLIVRLFPRNRCPASVGGRTFFAKDREKLKSLSGSATEVWIGTRVYGRDTNVFLDFDITHGTLGDEAPAEAIRQFPLAQSSMTPAAPHDTTSMPTLPDDGAFFVSPKMGLVDVQAKAYNATGSIEFETWATLIFTDGCRRRSSILRRSTGAPARAGACGATTWTARSARRPAMANGVARWARWSSWAPRVVPPRRTPPAGGRIAMSRWRAVGSFWAGWGRSRAGRQSRWTRSSSTWPHGRSPTNPAWCAATPTMATCSSGA